MPRIGDMDHPCRRTRQKRGVMPFGQRLSRNGKPTNARIRLQHSVIRRKLEMLGRLFKTLDWKVSEIRKDWASGNPLRLKYESGRFGRLFDSACEHPLEWAITGFIFMLLLSVATWAFPPPYSGLLSWQPHIGSDGNGWAVVEPFLGLWAVQATLVAIVYPIVVAFVTVLLQRQNASKASLHAYFARSAAKLTGLSALALVFLMAIQYVVLDTAPPLVAFAWLVGDSVWAIINVALCIVFLHATFEFASPEGRSDARFDYVLTQGWPAEWEYHIKRLISASPLTQGLVTGRSAVGDLAGTGPAFSNPGDGLAKGHRAHFSFRRERSVKNIRYRLVQVGYWLWSKKARRSAGNGKITGWNRVGPVFEFSLAYNDRIAIDTPIALASVPITRFQRWILRAAVSLSRRKVSPRVLVRDALEELRTEAAHAIQADAQVEFKRQLLGLMELLGAVVEASGHNAEGKPDNWVQLADPESFSSRELILSWLSIVRDLHGIALAAMTVRDVFAAKTVRLGSRFLVRQREALTDKLRQIYLQHQFILLHDLLDWGAEGCAAASGSAGGPGKVLSEPLRRRYDRVLRVGVGAWESTKSYDLLPRGYEERPIWEESASTAETLGLHLRFHAQLVVQALRADDRAGFEYFTDSLMKWTGHDGWSHERGLEYGDRYKVTVSDLSLPLLEFRARFPLPPGEADDYSSITTVRNVALINLWRDVVLTLAASALQQAEAGLIQQGLAARLVRHLIDGVPVLDEDGGMDSSRPFDTAEHVLSALLRQRGEGTGQDDRYEDHVDKVAESLGFSAIDRGISGRVYSRSGSEMDRILDAQLLLLARLTPANWTPGYGGQGSDRLRNRLRAWVSRLDEKDMAARYGWLWVEAKPEGGAAIEEHIDRAKKGLERLALNLNNLREKEIREAPIAQAAKERIATAAATALEHPARRFPLSLLDSFVLKPAPMPEAREASFNIRGYEKGAMTNPPLVWLPLNEDRTIRDITEKVLAREVLHDVVDRGPAQELETLGREAWLEALHDWEKLCLSRSEKPLAIVPSRADPPWLTDLTRKRVGETDEAAPIRKRAEFSEKNGYLGHLGALAIFVGPVPPAVTALTTIDEFQSLVLESTEHAPFVVDAIPDETGLKCTVTIRWRHKLYGKQSPARKLRHTPKAGV